MHFESGRVTRTLNAIGTKVDCTVKTYHLAAGMERKSMKQVTAKKYYEYCPSSEGLLPAWSEQVDHLIRWLRACFEVYNHENRNSVSRFPAEIFHQEFPEMVDISDWEYFHGFWATHETIRAYGLDKKQAWEKHTPTLLHFLGAMQQFIPYHKAVDPKKFQDGGFNWETGVQNNTYAKDIFDFEGTPVVPKAPALRLRTNLDGTCSPSYEGMADLRPSVSKINYLRYRKS